MVFAFALGLFAVLSLVVIAWATWLDYSTETRLLGILETSVRAGQSPPPEIVARFTTQRESAPLHPISRRAQARVATLFLAVGMGAFLASSFATEREYEEGFLFIAAVAALIALLLFALLAVGRRLGT